MKEKSLMMLSCCLFVLYNLKEAIVLRHTGWYLSAMHDDSSGPWTTTRQETITPSKTISKINRRLVGVVTGPAAPFIDKGNKLVFPLSNLTEAICNFDHDIPYSRHFPHTMQQLYGCISWWQANLEWDKPKKPVLLYSKPPDVFIVGLFRGLRNLMDLEVRKHTPELEGLSVKTVPMYLDKNEPYKVRSRQDALNVTTGILRHYNLTTNRTSGCPADPNNREKKPKIGFLNRHGTRRVDNYQEIIQAIEEATNTSLYYTDSYDSKTFRQQITVMSKVDILLGPHGAQFTNIPFMPECGGLVEFFPARYYVPNFFGSLATATGHNHLPVYTGNKATMEQDVEEASKTLQGRASARSQHLLVDPAVAVQAVVEMTRQWSYCCDFGRADMADYID